MILDPMPVPPLSWIDLDAFKLHTEVNVIASGQTCLPALADNLASFYQVALVHGNFAEMAINGLQRITVVHDDAVSVDTQRCGIHHSSVVRRLDTHVAGNTQIVAEMNLLIDLLPLVEITT